MNKSIANYLYGAGKIRKSPSYIVETWELNDSIIKALTIPLNKINFHEDYNLLMKAFKKVLDKEYGWWYAIYRQDKYVKHVKNKVVYNTTYSCAFTYSASRIGYGDKLNQQFEKETIILAMHYSLYRLITKGLEY